MPRPGPFTSPRELARAIAHEAPLRAGRARMERGLARAGRNRRPVIVGPWLSEIGFELLYWIPFLRRSFARHGIAPEQVTVVSRGGARDWYTGLADRYVDVLDLVDLDAYRAVQSRRLAEGGGEKHFVAGVYDRELLARAGSATAATMHPLVMYSRLRYFWAADLGLDGLERLCAFAPLAPTPEPEGVTLPARYVAVKPYFSACFPATSANRALVADLLGRLAADHEVVVLTTGLELDDHAEAELVEHPRVHGLTGTLRAQDNLAVQTRVIARADALVSTYGGPAYLGTFLRVPTVALASLGNHNPHHLAAAQRAAERIGVPALELVEVPDGLGASSNADAVLRGVRRARQAPPPPLR